jgi:hypothetical protein
MVQLQDSISKCLHHHTLSSMLSNRIFKVHCAQILSCSNPGVGIWFTTQLVFLAFWLFSPIFSTLVWTQLRLPHPSIVGILQCMCTHPIDYMGIHLLCCVHGNKHTGTHDEVHDTFVAIMWDVGFHVGQKQLHAFFSSTFNSFHWQVDIVLTKNDIHTLATIVIANPTWVDLFPWSCATQRLVASDAVQAKERSYLDRHFTDQFLPLAIEIFGCLHK